MLKEKYTWCTKCIFGSEEKWFSVVKIWQRVMQYFCSGRCLRVQRIFGNFLRILGAVKMRVALEHMLLIRVFEEKMNIFHLRKIFLGLFWDYSKKKWWLGERWPTWGKIKGMPKGLSPTEMIQKPKIQIKRQSKSEKRRRGKNQAVTNLPHLGWISSSRFGCLGKQFWIVCL